MLNNYVLMNSIKTNSTEDIMKAYLKDVYCTFRGSKYILSDSVGKYISEQFTWLAQELGFIQVYTSRYTPAGNSVTEWAYTFLKSSLRNCICNHNTDWDDIADMAMIAYNLFPHSSA